MSRVAVGALLVLWPVSMLLLLPGRIPPVQRECAGYEIE